MEKAYEFLRELAKNNNREWFHAHKDQYQESLELFRAFAGKLLEEIVQFDPSLAGLDPKETIFRIYKDVRFSRDKTPYKTHFGCWMARGGKKSTDAGYYFHLDPEGTFMAAGVHSPDREQLNLIRQEILFQPGAWLKVINDPLIKKGFERMEEEKLKTGPVGFPKDFEHLDELKYKHYIFMKRYGEQEVIRPEFTEVLAKDYRTLHPLVKYLNLAMSFTGNH